VSSFKKNITSSPSDSLKTSNTVPSKGKPSRWLKLILTWVKPVLLSARPSSYGFCLWDLLTVPTHSLFVVPLPLLAPQLKALSSVGAEPVPCTKAWTNTSSWVWIPLFQDSLAPPELTWHFGRSKEKALEEVITGWYFLAVFGSYWNARVNDGTIVSTKSWIWAPLQQENNTHKTQWLDMLFCFKFM